MKRFTTTLILLTVSVLMFACALAPLPTSSEVHNGAKRATLAKAPTIITMQAEGPKILEWQP